MKIFRWIIGFIFIIAFVYYNFFVFESFLFVKMINVGLFCTLFVLFRVIFGPSAADRIIAVEILGILIIGMLAIIGL